MLKALGTLAALLVAATTALAQGEDEFRRRAEDIERKFERAKKEMVEQLELERRQAMEELERSRRKPPEVKKERGGPGELGDVQGAIKELFGLIRELRAEIEELRSALRGFHGKEGPPRAAPQRKAAEPREPAPPKHAPDRVRPDDGHFQELMRAAEELKRRIHDEDNEETRGALKDKLDHILRQLEEFKRDRGGEKEIPPRKGPPPPPKHRPDMDRPEEGHLRELLKAAEELKRRIGDEENDEERGALKDKLGRILRQLEEFKRPHGEGEEEPPRKKDKRDE